MSIQKKRMVCLILILFGIAIFTTGCFTTDYDREDIEEYLIETYGFDARDIEVSKEPIEIEDEEEYTDYLWKVHLKDDPTVEFSVLDDYGWGTEWVTNYLHTDYERVMLVKLFEEYGISDKISLVKEEEDGLVWAELNGSYSNRAELKECIDELSAFKDYVLSTGYDVEDSMFVELEMENPLRYQVVTEETDYLVDDGDFTTRVTGIDEDTLKAAEVLYAQVCIDYRFMEQLSEFTQEEIEYAVSVHDYPIGLADSTEDTQDTEAPAYTYYTDLCGSRFAYGISFGTLYEILYREGLDVEGDSWHYTFTGADGAVYEVSYDFVGENAEEGKPKYYYYLRDGEVVWMDAYFYNHFSERYVRELTGLNICTGR